MNFPGDESRRDPDALLAQVQEQERRAARGRLRIFFGASAGVGKTYSMLSAARQLADTRDVLIGIVETHGRAETEALLEGLAVLPRKRIDYHGRQLTEFDIDTALERRPQLILVDELAHSNVAGSRHPKRWQDVEELLAAGIDVFTTVNVQHLESLNDVVGGITGVRVGETVPDSVFDGADEVVLVDLPADELLARLKLGKVYQPAQAERAGRNFFRKGNLIALRELALRRTAERIGDDVRAYRVEKSIDTVWRTGTALLACVGPGPGAEGVVRSAARLAAQLGAEWHAVYVETPALQRLAKERRERILRALKLAEELGATIETCSLPHAPHALSAYYVLAPAEASSNLARYDGVRYGLRRDGDEGLVEMYTQTRHDGFGPEVKRRILIGTYALSSGYYDAYYGRAQRARTLIAREFTSVFEDVDFVVTPTSPGVAFELGAKTADPLAMYLNDFFTVPMSLAGIPGISIPCGLSDGLPVGFQLAGPAFSENRILQAAHVLEGALGFDGSRARAAVAA